ncbi:MAG: SDR family oxidoreductase [Pseudomonadota bacterium]
MSAEAAPAGRRLLITGAARGIGAATARLAAARGWAVGVNYRARAEAARGLAAEIAAAGGAAAALKADVADASAIAPLFDAAEAALGGPLDAVVVNAGVLGPRAPLSERPLEDIDRLLAVNVRGALLTAREAARRLSAEGRSGDRSILFVSSTASRLGSGGEFVDYAAGKGALDTATRGLAAELGPSGVRVNAVRPGLIETEMQADSGWPERAETMGRAAPLGRAGRAEEVATAILWLLSAEASYVSGALLDVSGGR